VQVPSLLPPPLLPSFPPLLTSFPSPRRFGPFHSLLAALDMPLVSLFASAASFFLVGICLLQRLMYMPQRNFPSARKWSEGCLRLPLLQQLPREHIAPVRNRPQPPERPILVLKQGVMRRKRRLCTRAPRSRRPPVRCRCRRTARCTT